MNVFSVFFFFFDCKLNSIIIIIIIILIILTSIVKFSYIYNVLLFSIIIIS